MEISKYKTPIETNYTYTLSTRFFFSRMIEYPKVINFFKENLGRVLWAMESVNYLEVPDKCWLEWIKFRDKSIWIQITPHKPGAPNNLI